MMTFVEKKNSRSHAARAALCALALALALTMGLGPAEAETASPSNEGNGGQAAAGEKMASLPKEDDAYASGELLVVMRDTVSEKHMEDVAEDEGDALQDTTAIGTGDAKQTMAVVETGENDLENAMTSYAERSDVAYVQPNYIYTSADQGLTVKSTGSSVVDAQDVQWNLGANGIDAEKAWSIAESSRKSASKVKVAVLDTGLDTKQPDLQKNLDLADCRNVYSNSNKVTDYAGHGTHVAGIIAADNNEMGVTGVASGKGQRVSLAGFSRTETDASAPRASRTTPARSGPTDSARRVLKGSGKAVMALHSPFGKVYSFRHFAVGGVHKAVHHLVQGVFHLAGKHHFHHQVQVRFHADPEVRLVRVFLGGVEVQDHVEGERGAVVHQFYAGIRHPLMHLYADVETLHGCGQGVIVGLEHVLLVLGEHPLEVGEIHHGHV